MVLLFLVDVFLFKTIIRKIRIVNPENDIGYISCNSSAFGFLLRASSHAKPLRGVLMHLCHYAISRTLQPVQSPGLNCYYQFSFAQSEK